MGCLSAFLGLAAAASLFVVLMFSQASANGGIVSLHQLAQPNGLVIGVARAAMLLGVVAFGIAASQVASEYSQFVRSAVFAVIVGFAWLIAVENIITRIAPSTQQWLPGTSIMAVASGGVEGVSYGHGLILGANYLLVAIAAAMTVFLRSDVTA
jgi:ABC-2 type transport system permease protein